MPDELEIAIENAQTEFDYAAGEEASWAQKRAVAAARLEALKLAAQLRPSKVGVASPRVDAAPGSAPKGRQQGAISSKWRTVLLQAAARHPDKASDIDFMKIAQANGLEHVRLKDIKDRMSDYLRHGYVEEIEGGWRVTTRAKERFEDSSRQAPDFNHPEQAAEPLNETTAAV